MSRNGNVAVAIPARYGSTRFPGKPLAEIAGKPMIQWVCERAREARRIDHVVVATDHEEIRAAVEAFGGRAVMTSPDHLSGTDRIAEAVKGLEADLVVNLQGDEPLLPGSLIDRLVEAIEQAGTEMATVAVPLDRDAPEADDPNVVKVVTDTRGRALYFSRAPIPFARAGGAPVPMLWHWGIYAYRRAFLETFVRWPPGRLETCEKLEQLRALEHGAEIAVITAETPDSGGVDVPADVQRVEALLRERGEV